MSIRAILFLFPIPLIALVLPPIFIVSLSFHTYFVQHTSSLALLALWLGAEGFFEALFLLWKKKSSGNAWYLLTMLLLTLFLMIFGTSGDFIQPQQIRWFALSLLALLPLLFVAILKDHLVLKTILSLLSFSLLGFFQFCATVQSLSHPALTLAIAFSIGVAGIIAQKPLLRAVAAKTFTYNDEKAFLRFLSLLWGLLPVICMVTIGNGLLPNAFLSVLLSLALISRMLQSLKAIEETGGKLQNSYVRLGIVASWLEILLLIGSALLSSHVSQDILG